MRNAQYIWISHGHPDHLHFESLALLSRETKILLPDHYSTEIAEVVREQGFDVEVMQYRQWRRLSPRLRCLCLDNENQDGVLVVEADGKLVVDLNDSPLCGEERFLRRLIKRYDRRDTYLAALCAIDADMLNYIDEHGRQIADPPERIKPGAVWAVARTADRLGVGNYVCSSSQHIYVRSDSVWANPYRITWQDITQHWTRPHIRLIEPFVVTDLESGAVERKHPAQTSDFSQITDRTGDDDYRERLSEAEWSELFGFFRQFETIQRYFDYLDFVVAEERRRLWLNPSSQGKAEHRLRGIGFHAPRRSLCEAVKSGYFDDLLIGNFMKTELHNATLYPHFSPLVAKLGGNAKVFTDAEWRAFRRRYFRRNPLGYVETRWEQGSAALIEIARRLSGRVGVKGPLKWVYRKLLGDPVVWD